MLEKLECPCYKIASPEITDLELIDYAAKTKKPIIISTGIANIKDINLAIKQCIKNNNNKVILLNCISSYPAKDTELNLKHIQELSKITPIVGFSDHSVDEIASLSSVSLGAKVIEKHFKINDSIKTPDKKFSLNSNHFFKFVKNVKKGSNLKIDHVRSVRPGLGMSPQKLKQIIGKKLKRNAKKNTPVEKKYF